MGPSSQMNLAGACVHRCEAGTREDKLYMLNRRHQGIGISICSEGFLNMQQHMGCPEFRDTMAVLMLQG